VCARSQYCWVSDFVRCAHPKDGHEKIIAMLQGYLDESGIQDGAPVCIVAGYFGGPGQWKKLGNEWTGVLRDFNVPEFHAKQFWAFNEKRERVGPYKGWDDRRADDFLGRLRAIIYARRNKIHPVSAALVVESFNKLSHNQRRFLTGGSVRNGKFVTSGCPTKPYFVAFQSVILDIADHAAIGGKAHFAFDLNKNFKGYALDLYAGLKQTPVRVQDRLGDIVFPTGLEAVQLQAADLFCYLSYQHAKKLVLNRDEPAEPLLKSILQGMVRDSDCPLYDDFGMSELLKDARLPPDDRV
jgi:hypothetical protein